MKKGLVALLLAVMLIVSFATPALAIAEPDNPPVVNAVLVYEDLLEEGDVGVLVYYFLDYETSGNPPTGEVATEAFLAVFIDDDGVTQLKSVAPYTFQDSGYGRGLIWIYFTAAEAATLDRANEALYRVWLIGNPTLTWTPGPDPPKTVATIDYWMPATGDPAVLLALKVLEYAEALELSWTAVDLIEAVAGLGNRLTALGVSYFVNVIPDLRVMAPACFATGTITPDLEDISYVRVFGATMTDGTGTVTGSPITLHTDYSDGTAAFTNLSPIVVGIGTEWLTNMVGASILNDADGTWYTVLSVEDTTHLTLTGNYAGASTASEAYTMSNNVTVTAAGTFVMALEQGVAGTIAKAAGDTGEITGDPVDLVAGETTVTVPVAGEGTLTVSLTLADTQATLTATVIGTGFDLTDIAARFGMSRIMFSGILWMVLSIIICAGVYRGTKRTMSPGTSTSGPGNVVMLIFGLCIIGGTLLGMLDMIVSIVMFLGYGAFIGWVFFFKNSSGDLGRMVMFMGWMWFITCLIGGISAGTNPQASTHLTADITAADTTITVASTTGFDAPSIIVIGDERIAYPKITATTFEGQFLRALDRGVQDTEAVVHSRGDRVRSVEGMLLNDSLNYNIAMLSDVSGIMEFVTLPVRVFSALMSFIILPLDFLGGDLAFLSYIWGLIGLGFIVSLVLRLIGGRRV